MKAGERTWNLSLFREENMTFWPRSHPVVFPHLQTDHWSKMKTMVPVYLASVPAALLKDRGAPNRLLPPLTPDKTSICIKTNQKLYLKTRPSSGMSSMTVLGGASATGSLKRRAQRVSTDPNVTYTRSVNLVKDTALVPTRPPWDYQKSDKMCYCLRCL